MLHCIVSSLNCDHFYNQILFKNYYLGIHYFLEWYHHNSKGRQIYLKKHMNKNSRVHALKTYVVNWNSLLRRAFAEQQLRLQRNTKLSFFASRYFLLKCFLWSFSGTTHQAAFPSLTSGNVLFCPVFPDMTNCNERRPIGQTSQLRALAIA